VRARSVVGLALLLGGAVGAQDSVDALVRRRGEAFVAAMNAGGTAAALEAYARDHLGSHVAREGRAVQFAETMRADLAELGPIERHSLQVLNGGRLLFVFCKRGKGGAWQNYQFRVLADDEHRLQLAQAGKISVTDPLIRYLPSFPNPDFARRVTIHQLLTHTAGAGDYWDDAYEKEWGSITELRQMLPFVLAHLGESPAGVFSYSNSGFVPLGLVVEAASGTSYYDYVQEHVFTPAGMKSTGFPVRSDGSPDLALSYDPQMEAGAVKPGVYIPVRLGARGSSAGGASTTADDLLRFADALRSGVLLDRLHLELMTRAHVPYGAPDTGYGYGTIVEKRHGIVSYGHGGTAPGTQFELEVFPELDTVMVVMSNYNTIAAHEMASALDDLVRNGGR
jgi:hypothetical protein